MGAGTRSNRRHIVSMADHYGFRLDRNTTEGGMMFVHAHKAVEPVAVHAGSPSDQNWLRVAESQFRAALRAAGLHLPDDAEDAGDADRAAPEGNGERKARRIEPAQEYVMGETATLFRSAPRRRSDVKASALIGVVARIGDGGTWGIIVPDDDNLRREYAATGGVFFPAIETQEQLRLRDRVKFDLAPNTQPGKAGLIATNVEVDAPEVARARPAEWRTLQIAGVQVDFSSEGDAVVVRLTGPRDGGADLRVDALRMVARVGELAGEKAAKIARYEDLKKEMQSLEPEIR